jgi:hypothetical protein
MPLTPDSMLFLDDEDRFKACLAHLEHEAHLVDGLLEGDRVRGFGIDVALERLYTACRMILTERVPERLMTFARACDRADEADTEVMKLEARQEGRLHGCSDGSWTILGYSAPKMFKDSSSETALSLDLQRGLLEEHLRTIRTFKPGVEVLYRRLIVRPCEAPGTGDALSGCRDSQG